MLAEAFAPLYITNTFAASITVAANAASATASAQFPQNFVGTDTYPNCQLQIANISTSAWAYVNVGIFGSVTAATVAASYPIAPGSVVIITVDSTVTGASVILSTSTGNVIFTVGSGV